MELKPYFGLSEKGLIRLKKHHHHQLDTIVAQIDNVPFELPESSPIYRSRNSGGKDTKNTKVKVRRGPDKKVSRGSRGKNGGKVTLTPRKKNRQNTQRISYYENFSPSRVDKNKDTLLMLGIESRFALDRDQLSIDSTVLGGKTTLKEIKADADLTKNTGAGNKYTRLKTGKIRMKIEKWRHAFEMNGIIPSKQDLKTYEKFLQLLIRAPAGACRQNILEMVLADAMTEEGEYLLHSDFC
eukprot:g9427.t1